MSCACYFTRLEEKLIHLCYDLRKKGWAATVYWNEGEQLPTLMICSMKNLTPMKKWLMKAREV